MRNIVLDTNCLLVCLPKKSKYHSENTILLNPDFRFGLITSDYDDNKFVDCAIVANAEYLVSEDSHYKTLKNIDFPKVNVIGIRQFCTII